MKVIANLGLCVSIYDIKEIEGGFVYPGEGASTHTVYLHTVLFSIFFQLYLSTYSFNSLGTRLLSICIFCLPFAFEILILRLHKLLLM